MDRICGCKGIRTCLKCEQRLGVEASGYADQLKHGPSFVYCSKCNVAWEGWTLDDIHEHPHSPQLESANSNRKVDGILIKEEFISIQEEIELIKNIEGLPWAESQSGRRKQDFGPKVNFKKRKVRPEVFEGFPSFVHFVVDRFEDVDELRDFSPVELCHLKYDSDRGSSIDPHLDDSWLWGPRLVTLNLGTATFLTLTSVEVDRATVRIPMNPRSLIVLSSDARYRWPHSILRDDVRGVRLALTFRELSSEFLSGGRSEDVGRQLLDRAKWLKGP